jgi:hypothetical protein
MTTETIDHHRLKELLRSLLLPEWQRTLVDAVGDRLVADLVADARRGTPTNMSGGSMIPKRPGSEPPSTVTPVTEDRSGWRQSPPLSQTSLREIDAICDAFEANDRFEWKRKGRSF